MLRRTLTNQRTLNFFHKRTLFNFLQNPEKKAKQLSLQYDSLPPGKHFDFLNSLASKELHDFLKNRYFAMSVIEKLPEQEKLEFIKHSPISLKELIADGYDLVTFLKAFSQENQTNALEHLGEKFINELTINNWNNLIETLTKTARDKLFVFLTDHKLQSSIKFTWDMLPIIKNVPDQADKFLVRMGSTHLQKLIAFDFKLAEILQNLCPSNQILMLNLLGPTHIRSIIRFDFDLSRVLKTLNEENQIYFLKLIGSSHLSKIIQNKDGIKTALEGIYNKDQLRKDIINEDPSLTKKFNEEKMRKESILLDALNDGSDQSPSKRLTGR